VYAAALVGVLVFLAGAVDLGPFQGSTAGPEIRTWDAASRMRTEGWKPALSDLSASPIYSLLLSPLATDRIGAVRAARRALLFVLLPALSLLVVALTWRGAGPWPAVLAGIAAPAAAPVVLAALALEPGILAVILALGALAVLAQSGGAIAWLVAGVLLALAAGFQSLLAWSLFAVLLAGLLFVRALPNRRSGAVALVAGWVGGLVLCGVLLRSGSPVSPIYGIDLYRGHRAEASGVVPLRGDADPERWWVPLDYLREASRAKQARMTPEQGNAYWAERAIREGLGHPVAGLRRAGVKLLATLEGDPLPGTVSSDFLLEGAENPWPLRISLWLGRILVPLGLVGIGLARRRGSAWLLAGALAGVVGSWVTSAGAQTQLLSAVFGLAGLAYLARFVVDSRGPARLRAGWIGLGAVLLLGVLPARGVVPGLGIRGEDHVQLGALFDREGRGSTAFREYQRALRLEPDNPYPRLAIAGMLARDNVTQEAVTELERLREDHPDFVPGLLGLVRLDQSQQKWAEAAAIYGDLIRIEPWNPEHLNNLGTMYVQIGYFEQAARALESAVRLDPGYQIARDNLESLRERGFAPGAPVGADSLRIVQEEVLAHLRAGDSAAAEAALAGAYARFGSRSPELQFLDGTLHLTRGDAAGAVPLLEAARAGLGPTVPMLSNLGTAYAAAGRFAEARKQFEEALRLQPANLQVKRSLDRVEATLDSLRRIGSDR
jgi:tetratricopeptide (TPR) repeat protein